MEKLMTFEETRKYLSTSQATLYRMIYESKIPAYKIGRQWRFRRERLDKWLKTNENAKRLTK